MHHLILGYGYCGYYLAQELLQQNQQVTAISRHLDNELILPGLKHLCHDLRQPFHWSNPDTIIYYLIPPPSEGKQDLTLQNLLRYSSIEAQKVIYFGSSAVYGNHQGNWVTEESHCFINNARQLRRLDAEQQWMRYGIQHSIKVILLRIAGIYGPQHLPIEAALKKTPLIERGKAPYTNHIYVKDLARIAYLLAQTITIEHLFNIADGEPHPMGTLQQDVAKLLNITPAPYESWSEAWDKASPIRREYMQSSKLLNIDRLKNTLGITLSLTSLRHGIKDILNKK